ncbi:MAG: YigZ family protein [bacterium]|nr:YigZ family protein [bacterium]
MKTIVENVINTYEINKSKFITKIIKVNDIEDVQIELELAKKEYKDATHYCYAYIIDEIKKSSDDNEPSGTAGTPIMDVLNKNNLNYILCIVIRYFGGIKLGSGGLIRAYSTSVSNALKKANFINIKDGYIIKINCEYTNQKQLDYLLKKVKYNKEYNEKIIYTVECLEDTLNILDNNNIEYKIIDKKKIEIL